MISTKNRTYCIPTELVSELDVVCENESVNKSKLVSKLLEKWVNEKKKAMA